MQIGTVRETFFFNQTRFLCSVTTSPVSDFLIDGKYTFEVGGKKKRQRQLQSIENGYVVKDDIETGYGNIIPLWMFGMLYRSSPCPDIYHVSSMYPPRIVLPSSIYRPHIVSVLFPLPEARMIGER